jgi:seryl-tRNA synthetase
MLDINFIRENEKVVAEASRNKKVKVDIKKLLQLDSERRELQGQLDSLGHERNTLAKDAGGTKPSAQAIEQGKELKQKIAQFEEKLGVIDQEFQTLLRRVPNIPSEDTPIGEDASGNQVLRQVGTLPEFSFQPKEHWQLGQELDVIDSERASKVSGSRLAYLKRELVWLEFALIHHAFSILGDEQTLQKIQQEAGLKLPSTPFIPVLPPVLIKSESFDRMARLEPKEDRYYIPSDDLYLVGSAEHTMGAMHMDETFQEEDLPRRYVGFSSAFRRESGSYGKDVRGILRLHQFDKVEIESFSLPEQARKEQDFLVAIQEYFMRSLGLPYQIVLICTGDMAAPDTRQIDIETWMPGQNQYRETHTSDLVTDYQARRLKTKVKRASGKSEFVHMNDATMVAIGRTIIAIMENYQQADGSIHIPKALYQYLPFTVIPAR